MAESTLDEILSSAPAVSEEPVETPAEGTAPVEEPVAEPAEEPVEESGDPTEDQLQTLLAPEEPAPPAEKQPIDPSQFKGYLDERDKRQALEQELQQYREAQQVVVPDVDEDPAGHIEARIQTMQAQLSTQADKRFYDSSKFMAQSTHDDFDGVYDHFKTMAAENPALNQTAAGHAHPFEFAYQTATQDIEATRVRESGGVEAMLERAGVEAYAKARADLEAEFNEKASAVLPKEIPPATLATESSSAARTGPPWEGPRPLSDFGLGSGLAK